jgi:hypothetical protein
MCGKPELARARLEGLFGLQKKVLEGCPKKTPPYKR